MTRSRFRLLSFATVLSILLITDNSFAQIDSGPGPNVGPGTIDRKLIDGVGLPYTIYNVQIGQTSRGFDFGTSNISSEYQNLTSASQITTNDPAFQIIYQGCYKPSGATNYNCITRLNFTPKDSKVHCLYFYMDFSYDYDSPFDFSALEHYSSRQYQTVCGIGTGAFDLNITKVSILGETGDPILQDENGVIHLRPNTTYKAEISIDKFGETDRTSTNLAVTLDRVVQTLIPLQIESIPSRLSTIAVEFNSGPEKTKRISFSINDKRFPPEIDFNNNDISLELDVMRLCKVEEISGKQVPFNYQTNAAWSADTLGNSPDSSKTMGALGCAVTSLDMIFKYYGLSQAPSSNFSQSGSSFSQMTPKTLNSALYEFRRGSLFPTGVGFTTARNVVWAGAAEVAREGYIRQCSAITLDRDSCLIGSLSKVSFKERLFSFGESQRRKVEDEICAGNPVVLELGKPNGRSHFVVATGTDFIRGEKTFIVNNPGAAAGKGQALSNLKSLYPTIKGYTLYRPTYDPSMLMIYAPMNVHFVVTDPLGRRLGFDPTFSMVYNEIPGAVYGVESVSTPEGASNEIEERSLSWTSGAIAGDYKVDVFAIAAGNYYLESRHFDERGMSNSSDRTEGVIAQGGILTKFISHSTDSKNDTNAIVSFDKVNLVKANSASNIQIDGMLRTLDGSQFQLTKTVNIRVASLLLDIPASQFNQNKSSNLTKYVYDKVGTRIEIASDGKFAVYLKGVNIVRSAKLEIGFGIDDLNAVGTAELVCHGENGVCALKGN